MPEKAKPVVITRIEVLVHPFYTVVSRMKQPSPSETVRMKAKNLLGQWRKSITAIARDPSAILVVMPVYRGPEVGITPENTVYRAQARSFLLFAKKALGKRLFAFSDYSQLRLSVLSDSSPLKSFGEILKARGFVLDKKALHGRAFGEYFDEKSYGCVYDVRTILCHGLGINPEKISIARKLSVKTASDYLEFKRPARTRKRKNPRRRPT